MTPRNTAFLLDKDGVVAGAYDKVYLLVFGEYVPFIEYMPWFYKLIPAAGNLEAGTEVKVIEADLSIRGRFGWGSSCATRASYQDSLVGWSVRMQMC